MQADAKDLANLIRQLPPGYQTIFNLHAVEGYTHVEIGKMLGISEGTSRSQYARARALLISWLTKQSALQKKVSMPENDFEKQVQHIMDALRFSPAPVVWENVAQQIADKKRRKSLLWLPLACLLLATAGYHYIQYMCAADIKSEHLAAQHSSPIPTASAQPLSKPTAIAEGEKNTVAKVTKRDTLYTAGRIAEMRKNTFKISNIVTSHTAR